MTHDLSDFEQQLGQELKAAAYRRIEARNSKTAASRVYPILLGALATIAVVVMAAFVLTESQPQPAAAHPFKIIHLETEIQLEIVDLVKDPRAAEQGLQEELGIDIEFVAVPTPPELVGEVVGTSGSGTTNTQVIFDDTGRSERVILPVNIDGKLSLRYGREAKPGEGYHSTITSPICRDLWANTPAESSASIYQSADTIRYDTYDSDYDFQSDVPFTEIDPEYSLIGAMFLADDRLLIVYSAHLDALGTNRPNCGWSAPHS